MLTTAQINGNCVKCTLPYQAGTTIERIRAGKFAHVQCPLMTFDTFMTKMLREFPHGYVDMDNEGQLIIYTGLYEDSNGHITDFVADEDADKCSDCGEINDPEAEVCGFCGAPANWTM